MSIFSTERYNDNEQAFRTAFAGLASGLWTAEPGIIQGALAADGTCTVQLATTSMVRQPDGTTKTVAIAPLSKCPVKFFGGGGLFMTHPIANGDDCLVVFAKRCIDGWWQNGGVQNQLEIRLHDINDGFCIPGFFSVPRALSDVSMSSIQLRTASTVLMDISETQITMNVPLVVHGEVTANTVALSAHIHSDAGGSGDSGPPVPGT